MNQFYRRVRAAFIVAAVSIWLVSPASAGPDEGDLQTARLVHLGKLWNTVKYFHPFLAYKNIDWDAALVDAVPEIKRAKSVDDYQRAIVTLLETLHDPATHLGSTRTASNDSSATSAPATEWLRDKILLVRLNWLASMPVTDRAPVARKVDEELLKATGVILDCRGGSAASISTILQQLHHIAPSKRTSSPSERFVYHWGYRGIGGYAYTSRFVSTMGTVFEPKKESAPVKRYAFIVSAGSRVPPIALALQASDDGFIITEGKITHDLLLTQVEVDLGEGLTATVRAGELEYAEDAAPFHVDAQVEKSGEIVNAAMELIERATKGKRANVARAKPLPAGSWHADKTYSETPYPPEPLRLLAGYRIWAIARWFYPYRRLLNEDWDKLLATFIPKLSSARDEREYALTLAEMATHIADAHTRVSGFKAVEDLLGGSPSPVRVRWVEGKFVITQVDDQAAAHGAAVGDIVVAVDGEKVEDRAARLSKYTASSMPEILPNLVATRLLHGPEGSVARVRLLDTHGNERELPFLRTTRTPSASTREPSKILGNNIGYLDLRVLKPDQVDASLEALKGTRAMVIDLRTYPNGVFFLLGPRLNVKNARVAAQFYEPLPSAQSPDGRTFFEQQIPPTAKWKYAQPVVVLIDERAISQSEHTGLWLEAAHDVVFIGSRTCGANGDVTVASLPGGGSLLFTGHDVRHADGRQLQRVGLIPNIEVNPTIAGIRAGKDEVLERALQYINDKVIAKDKIPTQPG